MMPNTGGQRALISAGMVEKPVCPIYGFTKFRSWHNLDVFCAMSISGIGMVVDA